MIINKNSITYVSNSFLGIRSMGLFAPMSYWRSAGDPGIGDIDTFYKVIDFAKKAKQGIIQILPLNLPSIDNCPYAIASNFIFDPVYIGIKKVFEKFDQDKYVKAADLYASKSDIFKELRKKEKSTNDETRKHKSEILKAIFDEFIKIKSYDLDPVAIIYGKHGKPDNMKSAFFSYCDTNKSWLFDHVLFFILADEFGTDDFRKWDRDVAKRSENIINQLKIQHAGQIMFGSFIQWIMHEQLTDILSYAKSGNNPVDIMFDQPFAFGNADVWITLDAFNINKETLKKEYTQGAPPHRLDIPQHWQFTLLDFKKPGAKKLLLERTAFLFNYCTLLRIDHLLGYYQLYHLSEDTSWNMTLSKMGIWNDIERIKKRDGSSVEKRNEIYELIISALKCALPSDISSRFFAQDGNLRYGHVILACRKDFPEGIYDKNTCGWYEVNSTEHSCKLLYSLLNHNNQGDDYLEKIISNDEYFLRPDDSIRIGFFNPGLGEEIVSDFIQLAQSQGKEVVLENLGLVPDAVSRSLKELGASEFKPLYFGYQYFKGDHNMYWFDNIGKLDYASFAIHDTVTLECWWTGKGKWAEKKYYFNDVHQKTALINWLINNNYLGTDEPFDTTVMTGEMQRAVLSSVADSNANMAVFMMPDIFKTGEEGIINIPGQSGFWTARSPVLAEDLISIEKISNLPIENKAFHTANLINELSDYKHRNSPEKQFEECGSNPCILRTMPVCGDGYKQIRLLNESFLIDVVIYGNSGHVKILLNDNEIIPMDKIVIENKIPDGISVYRTVIPVTENHIGTNTFSVFINGEPKTANGYLIGISLNTDTNPLSDNYGKQKMG